MTDAAIDPRFPVGKFVPVPQFDRSRVLGEIDQIAALPATLRSTVEGLDDRALERTYRSGGWTVRQIVHHLPDSHLNAYCRFKLALTENGPRIKPYEEADWAKLADARLPVAPSLALLEGLHARWVALMQSMTDGDWKRTFHHPEHDKDFALWQVVALYAWHCRHHLAHIRAALEGGS